MALLEISGEFKCPRCRMIADCRLLYRQDDKAKKAHVRARDVLKFSPIVTDAYFHYTPSQIMLAALSIADQGLFERLIEATFSLQLADGIGDARSNAVMMSSAIRKKTVDTVQACREMLLTEPPERMTDFWGTVSFATVQTKTSYRSALVAGWSRSLQHVSGSTTD